MTVVEVVIAAFILFFVLTAMLGVVGVTTKTSIIAKQRTAMTNAVSSYIEYARGLPFSAVELRSVSPSGALDSVVTTTTGGFTVTLTNTVRAVADGTKELNVSAACSATGYATMRTSAFAAIRNSRQGLTAVVAAGGPSIDFGLLTPTEGAILYGDQVQGSGALYIDADAASSDGIVTEMEFRVGDQRLRDGASGTADEAHWTPGTASRYESFRWHTGQVIGSTSDPAVQDGWRIVRVTAIDDAGRHSSKERRFLVDNYAPSNPGAPRPQTTGWKDVTVLLNWDAAVDGTEPAVRYQLETYENLIDGTAYGYWTNVGSPSLTQPAQTLVSTAFSRYWSRVRAVSPRGLTTPWVTVTEPYYSRPLLSGTATCTVTGSNATRASNVTLSLACSPVDFPATGVTYDLYRGTSPATLALYSSGVTFPHSETIVDVIGKHGTPIAYYFQARVTFTPTSYQGGTPKTVNSDIVGPTPALDGGSAVLAEAW